MFNVIETPYCKVLIIESWNAPAGRYFIAYRTRNNFRHVLGLPVIDEFATFSSPIFFCPFPLLGKIYNAGISLAHNRDPEMGIDLGWPPLVVGYEGTVTSMKDQWEKELLEAIKKAEEQGSGKTEEGETVRVDEYRLKILKIGGTEIIATDAPLLPKQLQRVAELGGAQLSLAFSTANRITAQKNASPISVQAVSEAVLAKIITSVPQKGQISR